MKILHARDNIAGQASIISRAQRKLGFQSDVLVYNQQIYNFECDFNLNLDNKNVVGKFFSVAKMFLYALLHYDVFHFHYGRTFLPWNLDLPILRLFRKILVMHYWGSDVIQVDVAKSYTLLDEYTLSEIYPLHEDNDIRKKIARIQKFIELTLVGDYSLLPYSPDSIVVRQAVRLTDIPFIGCDTLNNPLIIIHAPTNRKIKGTSIVIDTIELLKTNGYNVELIIVENKPHREAVEIFKRADIVVDDLLQGPYGIFAIECMALGKPVVDRIDRALIQYYPDLPIINANPDDLYLKLVELIENASLRKEIGLLGRKYVERNHDDLVIGRTILNLYHNLLNRKKTVPNKKSPL
jgi:hypothetical protein